MNYIDDITGYIPKNEQETQDKKVILQCIKLFPENILLRSNEVAHIASSGFVINKDASKTLMIHHNILNRWAWTGGHADGNANLLEVAIEEVIEETGIDAKPLSAEAASLDILIVPGHVKNGAYVNSHLHLDVAYILVADENEQLIVKPDENSAVKWLPVELINEDLFSNSDVYLYTKLLQQARLWLTSLQLKSRF